MRLVGKGARTPNFFMEPLLVKSTQRCHGSSRVPAVLTKWLNSDLPLTDEKPLLDVTVCIPHLIGGFMYK